MTEKAFQEARKLMQRANYVRGMITVAKGNVAKWSNIEDAHKRDLKESSAVGANNMLQRAISKLKEQQQKFADLKFPDDNLTETINRCITCGK